MTCDACGNPATSYRSKLRSLRELRGILYSDGPDTSWDDSGLDISALDEMIIAK